jgi:dephospho-CoA kinase
MKIIGLTGGIASGKSTVSKMFISEHIPIIDTDKIAHYLLEKGTDVYSEIVKHFSSNILLSDQSINRKKLAQIIFQNKGKRDLLNNLVHPRVMDIVKQEIERLKALGEQLVVLDVPLLFESEMDTLCDTIICVYTTEEKQLQRLMERDHIVKEYALMKINAQMPLIEKCNKSDFVIDNSKSILETKKEFLHILKKLEVA